MSSSCQTHLSHIGIALEVHSERESVVLPVEIAQMRACKFLYFQLFLFAKIRPLDPKVAAAVQIGDVYRTAYERADI